MTTKQTSYTPGPWKVGTLRTSKRGQSLTWTAVQAEDGHYITDKIRTTSLTKDETQANARLIAAAPDLLEALQAALPILEQAHTVRQQRILTDKEGIPVRVHTTEGLPISILEPIFNAAYAAVAKALGNEVA